MSRSESISIEYNMQRDIELSDDDSAHDESAPFNSKYESNGSVHWAATSAWWLCCPLVVCCSWTTVEQNTELVTLHCGKFSEVYRTPGCFFLNPCGVEKIVISKAKISIDLPNTKVSFVIFRFSSS